ncbi:MAG TPA: PP2C family protein-serine/threonine phosphatase [Solirubrobacterales bacterium]|nr:PP2C family protein-serine/threonine phosphatase [Solirubrobacterales bacterium]
MPGNLSHPARIAWVCTAALVVFVAWLAAPGSADIGIGFFYAVPVGAAAWWWGARAAIAAVIGCTALYVVGAQIHPVEDFGPALATRVAAFAAVALAAVAAGRRLAMLEHSAEELEAIRAALAPSQLPDLPAVDAAAAFVPSELGVSGDFYLLTNGPDGSTVAIVGDVAGHGAEAARLATFVRARFAALAASTSDPAELLMLANTALVERPRRQRKLVSAVCLRYRAQDSLLSCAVAGHPPPLRLPGLAELPLSAETFLLGATADLTLENAERSLAQGEGVLAYTDGATDVRRAGATLGLQGLRGLLASCTGLPAKEMMDRAEGAILDWAETPIRDDLCILVLKPK